MKKVGSIILIGILLLTACSGQAAESGQMDYEKTKQMIVDILKTDEGKKALKEILTDEKLKQELVMDSQIVASSVEQTLTSKKGVEFWKKSFEDPKFAETMAKSMKKENEKLLKSLMKDPEYRAMMMEIMKDPELQKEVGDMMKGQDFRKHLQKVVMDTFESPLFKAKLEDILLKAAEEMGAQGGGQGQQGGGQGGQQSGGGGGEQDGGSAGGGS